MGKIFEVIGDIVSEVIPIAAGVAIIMGLIVFGGPLFELIRNFEISICGA